MNPKHTPGPWRVDENFVYALNSRGVNRFFASVQASGPECAEREELLANAKLIRAAPDLAAALQGAIETMRELSVSNGMIEEAEAVLRKAGAL